MVAGLESLKYHTHVGPLADHLSQAIKECDRLAEEKPTRELSLLRTKLDEATLWLRAEIEDWG